MDIVSRLKIFMDSNNISSSQLADSCGISRPTVSQILNGRNKKISDELIGKIHETYPELSVLWLMFGEGDMTAASNIKISEPQNSKNGAISGPLQSETQYNNGNDDLFFGIENILSNNFKEDKPTENTSKTGLHPETSLEDKPSSTLLPDSISGKKITNIVVFYADNTFQTFVPNY